VVAALVLVAGPSADNRDSFWLGDWYLGGLVAVSDGRPARRSSATVDLTEKFEDSSKTFRCLARA